MYEYIYMYAYINKNAIQCKYDINGYFERKKN